MSHESTAPNPSRLPSWKVATAAEIIVSQGRNMMCMYTVFRRIPTHRRLVLCCLWVFECLSVSLSFGGSFWVPCNFGWSSFGSQHFFLLRLVWIGSFLPFVTVSVSGCCCVLVFGSRRYSPPSTRGGGPPWGVRLSLHCQRRRQGCCPSGK